MNHFAISLTGTYTRNEIPPRCRKPRPYEARHGVKESL